MALFLFALAIGQVFASEDEKDALSTDPDELIDSEDSEGISGDEEDIFRDLLSKAGFHLTCGDNPLQPQVTLREKLLMDAGTIAGFLTGLRVYLDHPAKVKRLLLPTKLSSSNDGKKEGAENCESSPSLMHMLMGVKVLQQAIVDLLLDIMVECCQPSEGRIGDEFSDSSSKPSPDSNEAVSPSESGSDIGETEHAKTPLYERLACGDKSSSAYAVQSSDMNEIGISEKAVPGQPTPRESSADSLCIDNNFSQSPKVQLLY